MTHPFKDILVGQVLLGTIACKKVPEGMQLILPWICKAALLAQVLQINQQLLLRNQLLIQRQICLIFAEDVQPQDETLKTSL